MPTFSRGDWVAKRRGDYTFLGRVLWCGYKFKNLDEPQEDGPERCLVQNYDGLMHVFNSSQLERIRGDAIQQDQEGQGPREVS